MVLSPRHARQVAHAALLALLLGAAAPVAGLASGKAPAPGAPAAKPPARPHARARAHATRRPPRSNVLVLPYVARRVCPFECCVYRRWRAVTRLRVYAAERDTARVAFTIARGDSFEALTGDVVILHAGTARVLSAHVLRVGGARLAFAAGDSIPLLDYEGEGGYRAWARGRTFDVGQDDFAIGTRAPERMEWLRFERAQISEWWVHIRTGDGRDGWLRMDDDQRVDNADACA